MEKLRIPEKHVISPTEDDVRYANTVSTKLHDIGTKLHNLFKQVNLSPTEFSKDLDSIMKEKKEIDEYFVKLLDDISKMK